MKCFSLLVDFIIILLSVSLYLKSEWHNLIKFELDARIKKVSKDFIFYMNTSTDAALVPV